MSPAGDSRKPTLEPPASGVTVRMYNQGFGDCFLLAFRDEHGKPRYMLIDCGVHHEHTEGKERMSLVADDIADATGNHLHVVAVTHEHTDHLYGFKYGRKGFDKIDIDELWLAWTENPDDRDARALKKDYGMKARALAAAAGLLGPADERLALALQNVLGFNLPEGLGAAGGNAAQLTYLRGKSAKKLEDAEDYLSPPELLSLPGVPGVRIYVLGPPREKKWIRSLNRKKEMYHLSGFIDEETAFAVAALEAAGSLDEETEQQDAELARLSRPFDGRHAIPHDPEDMRPEHRDFFRRHYGFSPREAEGEGPAWRRIDTDWLAVAERLALKLNSKTNNTSLVLAIELTTSDPRKVMLFVGDAQVGSWLSWHELSWPDAGPGGSTVTTEDLLGRTVLYKVGHHGSHNATLKGSGLEMMDSPELVAMIPVDQAWANDKKNWEHPADELLKRLTERTSGRVIRTDRIPKGRAAPKRPRGISGRRWKAYTKDLEWDTSSDRLWIQFTVRG
jgi:beta-lactamase superfamily II metal-dependent hydrolase